MDAAVGQLVGHAGGRRGSPPCAVLEQLLDSDPVQDGVGDLVANRVDVALLAATVEPVRQTVPDDLVDDVLDGRGAQLLLGLTPELRLGERDLDRGDQAFLDIVLGAPCRLPSFGQLRQLLGVGQQDVVDDRVRARSKPGTWVPPSMVGMVLTNADDRGVVALDPAAGRCRPCTARSTTVILPSTGTFSSKVSVAADGDDLGDVLADRQVVDVVGEATGGDELLRLSPGAAVVSTRRDRAGRGPGSRPGRRGRGPRSYSMPASGSKMSRSGQNRTRVPVVAGIFLTFASFEPGLERAALAEVARHPLVEHEPPGGSRRGRPRPPAWRRAR